MSAQAYKEAQRKALQELFPSLREKKQGKQG
jgi:hypothetical protein